MFILDAHTDFFKVAKPLNKAFQLSDKTRTQLVKAVQNYPKAIEILFQELGIILNGFN